MNKPLPAVLIGLTLLIGLWFLLHLPAYNARMDECERIYCKQSPISPEHRRELEQSIRRQRQSDANFDKNLQGWAAWWGYQGDDDVVKYDLLLTGVFCRPCREKARQVFFLGFEEK
jgi:hypothetical protein